MTECRLWANSKTEKWADSQGKIYYYCSKCGIIQLDQTHILSPSEEQERYLRHNNTPENKGYIAYLTNFINTAIAPYIETGSKILDFGSGPIPVLSDLLTSRGFPTQSYDPFFKDNTNWENELFDAIAAVEVFEHLENPAKELKTLSSCLSKGSYLIIRTMLHNNNWISFQNWWYREDKTHISFYSETTINYICRTWKYDLIQINDQCEIVLRKK